jgi:hypothetical protein
LPNFSLPVNIDATYADDAGDASVKLHQQHHDTVHEFVDRFDTAYTPSSSADAIVTVAASDTPAAQKANSDYICDGIGDHVEIQAALDALQAATGGELVLLPGTFNVTATVVVGVNGNSSKPVTLRFCGGALVKWSAVTGTTPIVSVQGWNCDIFNPTIQGSGTKGNGVGLLLGGLGNTVHGCSVYSPRINACDTGLEFGIVDTSSTGDNTVVGGYISGCKVGIKSRGFVNYAYGVYIQGCTIGIQGTADRGSGKIVVYGGIINEWADVAIDWQRGRNPVFRDVWFEHVNDTATDPGMIRLGTSTTFVTNPEFGTLHLHPKGAPNPDQYGFRLVNVRGMRVEHAEFTDDFDAAFTMIRGESTFTGDATFDKVSIGDTIPSVWSYVRLMTNVGTGRVVVRTVPEVAGSSSGLVVGPFDPVPGVDYLVGKTSLGTYYAVDGNGHIATTAVNVGGYPASYIPGTTPSGSGVTAGEQTASGLKTVLETVVGNDRRIRLTAGTFDLGFNRNWTIGSARSNLTFEGSGADRTFLLNWVTGSADREPISFSGADRITVRDMTVCAWGDPWGGGSGKSGDSSDGIDCDSLTNSLIENVHVWAARDRGIIFDGQSDTTSLTYDNVIRRCKVIGTRPAAPTGTASLTAVAGGTLTSRLYTYRVTQVDAYHRESASLLAGTITPNGSQQVRVGRPTLATGWKCWRIYRASSGTSSDFYLVATIFDSALTTWDDNVADDTTGILYDDPGSATLITELSLLPLATVRVGCHTYNADRITWHDVDVVDTWSSGMMIERKGSTNPTAGTGVMIHRCRVRGAMGGGGVRVTGGTGWQISDNQISNVGMPSAQALEANTAGASSTLPAVSIARTSATQPVDKGTVVNNQMWDDRATPLMSYAVSHTTTTAASSNITVAENRLYGWATGPFNDGAGASSTFTFADNAGVSDAKSASGAYTVESWVSSVRSTSATATVTLPFANTREGRRITVVRTSASGGTTTIAAQAGDTISGSASITTQWGTRAYESDGATNWILVATT